MPEINANNTKAQKRSPGTSGEQRTASEQTVLTDVMTVQKVLTLEDCLRET
jgi:hypothetical protein